MQRTFFLVCLRCAWLPRAFPGIVAATCRRDVLSVESCCGCRSCSSWNPCPDWWWRPGCCTVATCRTDENFRWMLFAMSGLLTSNGQWPKLLFRLLCVPALLPLGQTPSSATTEAGVLLRPNHEIFCCMLLAVPFLLTSNGRRLKMLPRLLCVPARLPPASSLW